MKRFLIWFVPGLIVGVLIMLGGKKVIDKTSTNEYCVSCHIHPAANISWKRSVHYETQSGYRVACVECHLPPKGNGYLWAKGKIGIRDLWSFWTKDSASFNWNERGRLEVARGHVYESSCIKCHENLFPWDHVSAVRQEISLIISALILFLKMKCMCTACAVRSTDVTAMSRK